MIGLEARAANWVRFRLGNSAMDPKERIRRLLEETAEAAQSEGLTATEAHAIVEHVYSREPGRNYLEAGGVAVCLFAWAASRGWCVLSLVRKELERIEARTIEDIRASVERKRAAGVMGS